MRKTTKNSANKRKMAPRQRKPPEITKPRATRMTARESNRIRNAEKKRVLDEAARNLRSRRALEALEQDNFHEDPHSDLVMSKKVPKFHDTFRTPTKERRGRRNKTAEYYKNKYRKTFVQLLEEDKILNADSPNYTTAKAPSPKATRTFCAVCGNFSKYNCSTCGVYYCCCSCLLTHQDTRCLKWVI